MLEKIKHMTVIVLAALGVLFIVLMLMPDDEAYSGNEKESETISKEEKTGHEKESEAISKEEEAKHEKKKGDEEKNKKDAVTVNIPKSEVATESIRFQTTTLDNHAVTEDIFSDYDLTIVHVWGTFCMPCIAEMGDYAAFYEELPKNVNLVGIVCDVYDGIDTNVSDAKKILKNTSADFQNLRTSDDVYNLTASFQYVPSSFFVDGEGHIVGSVMVGAGFDETKERLEGYLE